MGIELLGHRGGGVRERIVIDPHDHVADLDRQVPRIEQSPAGGAEGIVHSPARVTRYGSKQRGCRAADRWRDELLRHLLSEIGHLVLAD